MTGTNRSPEAGWGQGADGRAGRLSESRLGSNGATFRSSSGGRDTGRFTSGYRQTSLEPLRWYAKKLSPSRAKDDHGEYHNVHINLHEDELAVAGIDIGDVVFVRVREDEVISKRADRDWVEYDF